MHTTLESAKKHSEDRRTQGTVFNIKEVPAVLLRSKSGCIVVTQINTGNPLAGYSADATTGSVGPNMKKIEGALDNYICRGAPMLGAALSFLPGSRFWKTMPPYKNSVIIISTNETAVEFLPLPTRSFTIKTSFSRGGGYLLGWTDREASITPDGVERAIGEYA